MINQPYMHRFSLHFAYIHTYIYTSKYTQIWMHANIRTHIHTQTYAQTHTFAHYHLHERYIKIFLTEPKLQILTNDLKLDATIKICSDLVFPN